MIELIRSDPRYGIAIAVIVFGLLTFGVDYYKEMRK
jgi:hypothetical protein